MASANEAAGQQPVEPARVIVLGGGFGGVYPRSSRGTWASSTQSARCGSCCGARACSCGRSRASTWRDGWSPRCGAHAADTGVDVRPSGRCARERDDFRGIPGLPEHALPFKTLADAVRIRNHVIDVLEQSSTVRDPGQRRAMLTFVVAGGGFSGTEAAAALNDFVRRAVRDYRSIPQDDVRIILVHSGEAVLERELTPRLAS